MKLLIIFLCFLQICFCKTVDKRAESRESSEEHWTGRWFPEVTTNAPGHRGPPMGIASAECDDGKTEEVGYEATTTRHMCLDKKSDYEPDINIAPLIEKDTIPPLYVARHVCMNSTIEYDDVIPTYGTHRPLWPKYGEYLYAPKQRWIHSLEHGGVVMLYHPCANKHQVNKLREIVTRCLWRHVITPMETLSPERPLALVTWGWRLQMSYLDPGLARDFITLHSLKGPERLEKDGQYSINLVKPAEIVTDNYDSYICKDIMVNM